MPMRKYALPDYTLTGFLFNLLRNPRGYQYIGTSPFQDSFRFAKSQTNLKHHRDWKTQTSSTKFWSRPRLYPVLGTPMWKIVPPIGLHSLPVHHPEVGPSPCPILSAELTSAISSHNCHWNVSLTSGASLWMVFLAGSKAKIQHVHSGVAGSISSGGDHSMHCWLDPIRSKQLFSVPYVACRCLLDYLVMVI